MADDLGMPMSDFPTSGKGSEKPTMIPLLKWPGGKRALVKYLLPRAPTAIERYYEPFLGGGALFFALQPKRAILSDNNVELINCYRQIKQQPHAVIAALARWRNTERDYYAIRDLIPIDEVTSAARLVYLTTLSFNGIYRVNLRGVFNVPYGHKSHLHPGEPATILAASSALANAELRTEDFEAATSNAQKGDFVYFDPPYTVAHGSNGFVKYNAKIFSWYDQQRLAAVATQLVKLGCHVVISNADHASIHELYAEFKVHRVTRHSVIAASDSYRRPVTECIFYS